MAALALSFGFFLFVTFVGRATLALFRWHGGILRAWLLAPAIGLSVLVLATMALNQAGLPVLAFARPLTLGLALACAGIFHWRRPATPLRALAPFFLIALFSLGWTGWPMLRFGFGWLSYVNDDFVNYCLAAERHKEFGFWRVPTMEELAGRDIAQYYWFMHVPGLMRFGSELTLAWLSAVSGVKSLGIFMPTIVGLGLIQLFATAALVLHRGRWRRRALVAIALLAASPLFMLGTLYQLIAQVGGVALFLAAAAILTSRLPGSGRRLVPHVLALSLVGSALAVFYPEVSSFPVLTMVGVAAVDWWRAFSHGPQRHNRPWTQRLLASTRHLADTFPTTRARLVLFGCVGALVLLRYNVLAYVFTILLQMGQGFRSVDLSLSLFPYFMIPTGLANLFGLMPLAVNLPEPMTSVTIIAGLLALVIALGFAVREIARPYPIGVLLVVQFGLALYLLSHGNDFGLYKAAMFMQPALAGALAVAVLKLPWSRISAPLGVLVVATCCAPTALYYTRVSQGEKAGGITEAKLASILGTKLPAGATAPNTRLLSDINNLVAAKLAAFEARGTDLRFLSRDYYQQIAPIEYEKLGDTLIRFHPQFDDLMKARGMLAARDEAIIRTHSLFDTSFRAPALSYGHDGKTDAYLLLDESFGLFNKFRVPAATPAEPKSFFKLKSASVARNHLVFMHSGRGNHYYLGDRERVAMYQPEADLYTSAQDMTGLGRFLLLRVEQPDQEFYLRISASKTMNRGHTAWSAGSRVLGAEDVPLAFPGNGAVNRIVGPIRPVYRDGAAYIGIDFKEQPAQFPFERKGLQSLYNTIVPLDPRKLVAYGRDISALSTAEFAALQRPNKLTNFPHDIVAARGLEFAGIYEDGWLSPKSEFALGGGGPKAWVRLRGFVPDLPGRPLGGGTMQVTLPSGPVELPASVGSFDWLLPVGAADETARLAIHFSNGARLPDGDDRPVGGKLEWLEVFRSLPTYTFEFGKPTSARLASTGIDQDGWFARTATIQLPPFDAEHEVVLTFEYPGWADTQQMPVRAESAAMGQPEVFTLKASAPATVRLKLTPSSEPRTLRLEAPADFPLAAPDTRRRAGRLVQMELQPTQRS